MFIKMAAVGRLFPGSLDKPVAVRRVTEKGKKGKKELMLSLRPTMFKKLFDWSNVKKIETSRRAILWDQYCYYQFIRIPPERKRDALESLYSVMVDALKYPFLLKDNRFYHRYMEMLVMIKKRLANPKAVVS
jgi:hypothetical protein